MSKKTKNVLVFFVIMLTSIQSRMKVTATMKSKMMIPMTMSLKKEQHRKSFLTTEKYIHINNSKAIKKRSKDRFFYLLFLAVNLLLKYHYHFRSILFLEFCSLTGINNLLQYPV